MKKINDEEIRKLRDTGKSYNEICSILNCSKGTVSKYCRGDTLARRSYKKNIDDKLKREIEEFLTDHTYTQTAEKFNIGISTIKKYIIKKGSLKKLRSGAVAARGAQTISSDTKLIGDISEYAVLLEAMKRGISVSTPVGDRLSYDLIFDMQGVLFKIQVKTAWKDKNGDFLFGIKKTMTNSRVIKTRLYKKGDFDFLIAYTHETNHFYVFDYDRVSKYKSAIYVKTQQDSIGNWEIIRARAEAILHGTRFKVGKTLTDNADGNPVPSRREAEGVET